MNQPTVPVKHVQTGDPLTGAVASTPTKQLDARFRFLQAMLAENEAGRAVVWQQQRIAADVEVGQAVYWNADNYRFERALAGVESDAATGALVATAASNVAGLLLAKTSAEIGNVVLDGVVVFATFSAAVTSPVPGLYYLSAAEPGRLVSQRPPIAHPICTVLGSLTACDTNVVVLVRPQPQNFLADHVHHRFDLTCMPAGDHDPAAAYATGRHTITNADASLPGWLPASDPAFGGNAPAGAVFGYNLAQQPALASLWPPVPLAAVEGWWDKGENLAGGAEIDSRGPNRLVIFDAFGIWWMSDCYGDVPWPRDLEVVSGESAGVSVSESAESISAECPRLEDMRFVVAFLHMLFGTAASAVTSLVPGDGEPFTILNCRGAPASVGDLVLYLTLAASVEDETYGGQAIKSVMDGPLRFGRGWLTEGLVAGSDRVTLTSTHQRRLTPGDTGTPLVHQGIVTVNVPANPIDTELNPQVTKLGDALEREHKGVLYLGLPANRTSGLLMRFNIPPAGLPTTPTLQIRLQMLGTVTGTLPGLTLEFVRVPRADLAAQTLGTAYTAVAITTAIAVVKDEVSEVASDTFTIVAGDTVFVRLTRAAAATPSYNGEVGLLRVGGIVEAGGA